MKKWWRLLVAIYHREPWDHIEDLYGLATGKLVECGRGPLVYLLHRDTFKKRSATPADPPQK